MPKQVIVLMLFVGSCVLQPAVGQGFTVSTGADVKVTNDNNNVATTVTPSLDGHHLPQNETSIAVSPVNPSVLAIANNDFKLLEPAQSPCFHYWMGVNVSLDGGATWFNTMIPGFGGDTSPAGVASPLHGRTNAPDPVARFDAWGNLYVAGVSDFCSPVSPAPPGTLAQAAIIFLARYAFTPGTPAGVSTPASAGNPPSFTYLATTAVQTAPVGEGVHPPGLNGGWPSDLDKPSVAIDSSPTSPYFGRVYVAWTPFPGKGFGTPIVLARSGDSGATFGPAIQISQGGAQSAGCGFSPNLALSRNGDVLAIWAQCPVTPQAHGLTQIRVFRSTDGGSHFSNGVTAAAFANADELAGLIFRTEAIPQVVFDDLNPQVAYITFQALNGNPANSDVFVVRTTDGGATWGPQVRVNDDATAKHQITPAVSVSHGALHVAWFDFRQSPTPLDPGATNSVLHVYYAYTGVGAFSYPAFSPNVQVADVPSTQCDVIALAGFWDYIEIGSTFNSATGQHFAHVSWPDTRDIPVSKCSTPTFDPFDPTGTSNVNLYSDTIVLTPVP